MTKDPLRLPKNPITPPKGLMISSEGPLYASKRLPHAASYVEPLLKRRGGAFGGVIELLWRRDGTIWRHLQPIYLFRCSLVVLRAF